jgi:hypothetical protein
MTGRSSSTGITFFKSGEYTTTRFTINNESVGPGVDQGLDLGASSAYWDVGYINVINTNSINSANTAAGVLTCSTLTPIGASVLQALNATNVAFSGYLSVAGTSTLAATNTGALSCTTFAPSGTSTMAALTATTGSFSSTLSVTGATTFSSPVTLRASGTHINGNTLATDTTGSQLQFPGSVLYMISNRETNTGLAIYGTNDYANRLLLAGTFLCPGADGTATLGSSTQYWGSTYVGAVLAKGHIRPYADDTYTLGDSTHRWNGLSLSGSITGCTALTMSGSIGVATGTDDTYNIGTNSLRFHNCFFGGTVNTVTIAASGNATTNHKLFNTADVYDVGATATRARKIWCNTIDAASTTTFTGASTFGSTISVTGASTLAGLTATTGSFSSTLAVTGNVTITADLLNTTNNTSSLGSTSNRWLKGWFTDITSTNAVVVSSDSRVKKEITPLAEQKAVDFINSLKPVSYKYNPDRVTGDTDKHYGLIAQDVACSIEHVMMDTPNTTSLFDDSSLDCLSLRYQELIAPMITTIQNLCKRVDFLEKKLASTIQYEGTITDMPKVVPGPSTVTIPDLPRKKIKLDN